MSANSHHTVRESIRQRIEAGEWQLGALIPAETILAEQYGCARTTINRALQTLADQGLLIRKRKGGTRVCETPVRQAKLEIAILREQVEASGNRYVHNIISKRLRTPPQTIRKRLKIGDGENALYMETTHLSNERPYAYEERWINIQTVPQILEAPLEEVSANEWLVRTVPFSRGDVTFKAVNANKKVSKALKCKAGSAIIVLDRTTWMDNKFITAMKLFYKDGYEIYSTL